MTLRMGSLFAGYEGLGLGVSQVLDVELAWVSEIESAPSAILAHHYPHVPNHGDITTIDWSAVEPVDVLTGGFPCQDVSAAGKRAGLKPGTRTGLWSHMAYAIDQLRPRLVVAENVRGLLSAEAHSEVDPCPWCVGDGPASGLRALGAVLGDLADLGYDARWCGLRAADVGAPHGRFRIFIVAWPADAEGSTWGLGDGDGRAAAYADDIGQQRGRGTRGRWPGSTDRGVPDADADVERLARPEPPAQGRWAQADDPERRGLAAADAAGDGRHEGRPEPTRVERGSDAAERSPAADTHDGANDRERTRPKPRHRSGATADARRGAVQRRADGRDVEGAQGTGAGEGLQRRRRRDTASDGGAAAADTERGGWHGRSHEPQRGSLNGTAAAGCREGDHGVEWGAYEPAIRRWERTLGRVAPPPTEPGRNGAPRLSPRFVEWLMGLPAGWVTDVRTLQPTRTPHVNEMRPLSRNDQLKALGNGVVPQQAAEALRWLLASDEARRAA